MMSDPIAYLRRILDSGMHNDVQQMIRDRDSVILRYQPLFSEPSRLSDEDLLNFLEYEHNKHWWGLASSGDLLIRRAPAVRSHLDALIDHDKPIAERIDDLGELPGFTPSVYTPMLLMVDPDQYGVWNTISESAMRRLGLWPDVAQSVSIGSTYAAVNEMLGVCAAEVGTDLWVLDALWWAAEKEHDPTKYFVRAGARARRTPGARTRSSRKPATVTTTRARTVDRESFVCQSCWTTKIMRLESSEPNICVDCA